MNISQNKKRRTRRVNYFSKTVCFKNAMLQCLVCENNFIFERLHLYTPYTFLNVL